MSYVSGYYLKTTNVTKNRIDFHLNDTVSKRVYKLISKILLNGN